MSYSHPLYLSSQVLPECCTNVLHRRWTYPRLALECIEVAEEMDESTEKNKIKIKLTILTEIGEQVHVESTVEVEADPDG